MQYCNALLLKVTFPNTVNMLKNRLQLVYESDKMHVYLFSKLFIFSGLV